MEKLSFEGLQNIFQQLSQQNIANCSTVCRQWHDIINTPVFYSTINLYSVQQLKKFINTVRVLYIQDKPMIYYVRHLVIHFTYEYFFDHYEYIIKDMVNIQTIKIHTEWYDNKIYGPIPQFDQLIHRPKWYKGPENQLRKLKSLEYDVLLESNNELELEFMYLKSIDPIKTDINRVGELQNDNQHKILILPSSTLDNLTYLNINFDFIDDDTDNDTDIYDLDERTLESIHQSCPQLEILKLNNFYMNISEEYNTIIYNINNHIGDDIKKLSLAQKLKEINICGTLMNPRCFMYLSLKYPHLVSFTYHMLFSEILNNDIQHFESAIYQMITKNCHLKRFSFEIINSKFYRNTQHLFPQHEFVQWLNDNPKQINHLSYPFHLIQEEENYHQVFGMDKKIKHLDSLMTETLSSELFKNFNVIQNATFLNHLSSLSMDGIKLMLTIINYLLMNENTISVSDSIKELKIYSSKSNNSAIDVFNYLDVFPNLNIFRICGINIKDGYTFDSNRTGFYNDDVIWTIRRLIKTRKQQLGKKLDEQYKLKELELKNLKIRYQGGLDSFFSRFSSLNRLTFSNIIYCVPERASREIVYICIPHLSLDSVLIKGFKSTSWNSWYFASDDCSIECAYEISIEEILTGKRYTICENDWYGYKNHGFDLTIKCKYLDKIVYIK